MKTENEILNGGYYGLSPKCYFMYEKSGEVVKKVCKGISRDNCLTHSDFKRAALDISYSCKNLEENNQFSKKKNEVQSVARPKRALNAFYTKMCTDDNLVTVKPLSLDGKYL